MSRWTHQKHNNADRLIPIGISDWLHMRALKRTKATLWGQEYTVRPMLLDAVFGDGKEWVWFEYMDDRPSYYIARVPSGTHKAKGYPDVISDIEDAIRNEATDFYSERAWREHDRKGYASTNRRWPIPPDMACGSAWGAYKPPEHVLAMCNDEIRRPGPDAPEQNKRRQPGVACIEWLAQL